MKNNKNTTQMQFLQFYSLAVIAGLFSILFPGLVAANLFGGEEPLAPEIAFNASIESINNENIMVSFDILDEYYLYRDKLAFTAKPSADPVSSSSGSTSLGSLLVSSGAPSILLGIADFPDAQTIEDDYFGIQAVYRGRTNIAIPYTASNLDAIVLSVKFQGCADIGLCYPPTTVELPVELPAGNGYAASGSQSPSVDNASPLLPSSTSSNASNSPTASLSDEFAFDEDDELLPPEVAYLPQIESATGKQIALRWFIEDGYYLYRDKLNFSLSKPETLEVGEIMVSEGLVEHDEFYGNVSVLRHSAQALLSLESANGSNSRQTENSVGELTIFYQGCADIGVCFPPSQVTLPVSFSAEGDVVAAAMDSGSSLIKADISDAVGQVASANGNTALSTSVTASTLPAQSEHDRLSSFLAANSVWLTIATFFGLGLLLAFTPCVLPMIPILSSLIVGQGQNVSAMRAFQLSLVYVLVMASTYALVGIFVGLSGYNIQAFLQSPAVLIGIAVLFIAFSLSMFGFYELQMPVALQNKLTQLSNRQGSGQVGGVAAMGFISTLVVGPCVTAPLAGALLYIAKTGDALVGGTALFALGLGMGAPLLLIGTSAGKLLPKSGAWMNSVKYVFGVMMLAMAIYMLSRFLPATVTMVLYGILILMSGVYLGAFDALTSQSCNWHRFGKGAGLAVTVYGVALIVGALAGANSYTRPLGALASGAGSGSTASQSHSLPFQPVKSVEDLQAAVAQASAQGRPVMLDFYADWCISCKEMDALTFSHEKVQALLSNAVVVQADVTANDALDQALLKKFDLFGPPGIIFYNAQGTELPAARVVGFMNADDFSAHIERSVTLSDT